jgi:hypothetical protein
MNCLICRAPIFEYKYGFKTTVIQCKHIVCDNCVYMKNKCPICHVNVFTGLIKYIDGMTKELCKISLGEDLDYDEKQLIENKFEFSLIRTKLSSLSLYDEILVVHDNTIIMGRIFGNIIQNCIVMQRDNGSYYRSYPSDRLLRTEWNYFYKIM